MIELIADDEVFVPINGYEDRYKISNYGRVWGEAKRWHTKNIQAAGGTFMKLTALRGGHLYFAVQKDGKITNCAVHRLVAEHFIDNPLGLEIIDHINGTPTDNHVSNLRWCTKRQNCSFDNVKRKKGSSKYVGVYFNKIKNRWVAVIMIDKKQRKIGSGYKTEEDAHKAYQAALPEKDRLPQEGFDKGII